MAKITVYGMEQWLNDRDQSLFDGVTFPEGIIKDTAVKECVLAANEFEVLYSDPYFFREAVTQWGAKFALTFGKWVEGFAAEFSPIDNYNRTETWSDHSGSEDKTTYGRKDTTTFGRKDTTTFGRKDTTTLGHTDTTTYGKTDTTTHGTTEQISHAKTDTHEVSAFDSGSYQPKDKNTEGGTTTTTHAGIDSIASTGTDSVASSGIDSVQLSGSDSVQLSGSDSVQLSGSDTVTGKANSSHSGNIHGNIGVTKTTEILESWTEFYKEYNIYKLIADVFVSEFCIMVY